MKKLKNKKLFLVLSFIVSLVGCSNNVKEINIKQDEISIIKGFYENLDVEKSNDNIELIFKSADTSVATVSSSGQIKAIELGSTTIEVYVSGEEKLYDTCVVNVIEPKTYKVELDNMNLTLEGYPNSADAVSFYITLDGKGGINMTIDEFMDSMPLSSSNPDEGFVGNPKKEKTASVNKGKYNSMNPKAMIKWFENIDIIVDDKPEIKDLSGTDVSVLIEHIKNFEPVIVWVTEDFKEAVYKNYSWGKDISNSHTLVLVGYNCESGDYLVNDSSDESKGEYWVEKELFEKCYNYRKYAVVITH